MKLKINLYGDAFLHNLVDGHISSTDNQSSNFIEFVTDSSGEINLFVDSGIYEIKEFGSHKKNYGWLLESKSIRPDIYEYFLKDTRTKIAPFEKIFTHNDDLLQKNSKFEFAHPIGFWVKTDINLEKSKLVSMITSDKKLTPLQKKRVKFARKNKSKIDLFGNGFNYIEKKEEGLQKYCYSFAFENDMTNSYFSEKILDCFATKTIPIYKGTKNIQNFFNKDGIIFFDEFNFKDLTFENYKNKLKAVNENYELVKEYRTPEDAIYKKLLDR